MEILNNAFTKEDLIRIREVLDKENTILDMDPVTGYMYGNNTDLINKIDKILATIYIKNKKEDINKDISVYKDKLDKLAVQIIGIDLQSSEERIITGRIKEIKQESTEEDIINNVFIEQSPDTPYKDMMVSTIEIKDLDNDDIIIRYNFIQPENYFKIAFFGLISFCQTFKKEV